MGLDKLGYSLKIELSCSNFKCPAGLLFDWLLVLLLANRLKFFSFFSNNLSTGSRPYPHNYIKYYGIHNFVPSRRLLMILLVLLHLQLQNLHIMMHFMIIHDPPGLPSGCAGH